MNTIKLLCATALLVAGASAFASQDDGNLDNAWLVRPTASASAQTPAPAAAATAGDSLKTEAAIQQGSNNEVTVP